MADSRHQSCLAKWSHTVEMVNEEGASVRHVDGWPVNGNPFHCQAAGLQDPNIFKTSTQQRSLQVELTPASSTELKKQHGKHNAVNQPTNPNLPYHSTRSVTQCREKAPPYFMHRKLTSKRLT